MRTATTLPCSQALTRSCHDSVEGRRPCATTASSVAHPCCGRLQDVFFKALGATGGPSGKVGPGTIVGITLAAALIAAAVGLAVHKLRMRHVMQSEIRSIMSQYMPLVRPGCLPAAPALSCTLPTKPVLRQHLSNSDMLFGSCALHCSIDMHSRSTRLCACAPAPATRHNVDVVTA